MLYLDYAPGPKRARRIHDLYMAHYGTHIRWFQSTGSPGPQQPWNANARATFETSLLPQIQQKADWGYGFADGKTIDYHLFMFHGYRPASQPNKASFFRFEWPWNTPKSEIFDFASCAADEVPFLSGTAGYILSAKPFNIDAYNRMFALCMRYWGIEAWNLDETVNHVRNGYKIGIKFA